MRMVSISVSVFSIQFKKPFLNIYIINILTDVQNFFIIYYDNQLISITSDSYAILL